MIDWLGNWSTISFFTEESYDNGVGFLEYLRLSVYLELDGLDLGLNLRKESHIFLKQGIDSINIGFYEAYLLHW